MTFVPFDASEDEIVARSVLRPGVPASMRGALSSWIHRACMTPQGNVAVLLLRDIENNLDVSFGLSAAASGYVSETGMLNLLNGLSERALVQVADYRLHAKRDSSLAATLQSMLRNGRSQYEVVEREGRYRLSHRVPEGVQDAADALMADLQTPGLLLRKAWQKLYDLTPDDSGAYASAVKAVEAAALPVMSITKETATVSDVIRAIEKKDASWRLPFKREHTEYPSRDVLLGMLKSLYRGQRDRHGGEAYKDVTHDEAEAAVLMAVTLVGLFARNLVRERDTQEFI